jgi:4'-phosphopantetheinyl transferase
MLVMDNNSVYIHIAAPENIRTGTISPLNLAERTRAENFMFAKDRGLYTAAHIFLRQRLSQYASLAPEEWCFVDNAFGRPFVSNPGYQWLQFNLSHTPGLVACIISADGMVGIDVEQHKALSDLEGLCWYALAYSETNDIFSIKQTTQREERFYTFWTLKEAYIKALGMGLSLPLQQFSFFEDEKRSWSVSTDKIHTSDQAKSWRFDYKRINGFHLSVATTLIGPLIYHYDI